MINTCAKRCYTFAAVQRKSVSSRHMRCRMIASLRATATIAFWIPRRLAMAMPHALRGFQRPCDLGLIPRLYQSGETARIGRVSKCGDAMMRVALYEAAFVALNGRRCISTG